MHRIAFAIATCLLPIAAGAASPVVVDANGRILGFYEGKPDVSDMLYIVSTMGFAVEYRLSTAEILTSAQGPFGGSNSGFSEFYFQSADCTGQPHTEAPSTSTGGSVGRAGSSGEIWYIPKGAEAVAFTTMSRRNNNNGACEPGTFYPGPFFEVLPNNPAATGVSNDPAVPPLRVEVLEVSANSWRVFYDGFESSGVPGDLGLIA